MMNEQLGLVGKFNFAIKKAKLKMFHSNEYDILNNMLFLTYTMGKVGSMSIDKAIASRIFYRTNFHVHFLTANGLKKHKEFNQTDSGYELATIIEQARRSEPGRRLKVITVVRDPLSRDISDLFQNYKIYLGDHNDSGMGLQKMLNYFKQFDHAYGLEWLDEEIKGYLNIDVYAHLFDPAQGYQIIHDKNCDLLVFRLEDLNKMFEKAMLEFTGLPNWKLEKEVNTGEDKSYAELYSAFKKEVVISDEVIKKIYDSKFFKHFYTDSEKRGYIKKWTRS